MKFYNRKKEIQVLKNTKKLSQKKGAQFTILVGRRRIGKSELLRKTFENPETHLYFFVSKKRSKNLLTEFTELLSQHKNEKRAYTNWDEFIRDLFKYSIENKVTLIFDEFQNFQEINEPIFDIFQKHWDQLHKEKNLNIIVAGSLISLLEKLFYDSKEPLYKRATKRIWLKEFTFKTVYKILSDNRKKTDIRELLYFYSIFGGNPYYYSQIDKADLFNESLPNIIQELILTNYSVLQNEGKEILIQEFGSEHKTYFSILESIALNNNTFTKIKAFTDSPDSIISRGLKSLEAKFNLIKKLKPVYPNNLRTNKYKISNNFIDFWFKYVYSNQSFISSGNFKKVLQDIKRDLDTRAGKTFEDFCTNYLINLSDKGAFNFYIDDYGTWWNKKAEIDIVAGNKKDNIAFTGECKLNCKNIDLTTIKELKKKTNLIDSIKSRNNLYGVFCANKINKRNKSLLNKNDILTYDKSDFLNYLTS